MITYEGDYKVLIGMLSQAIQPIWKVIEALSVSQIEDEEGTDRGPVVSHRDGSVPLGATGVPDLCFEHYATFKDDFLSQKLDPNRRRYAREYALMISLTLVE
jgi:hypothetical protein